MALTTSSSVAPDPIRARLSRFAYEGERYHKYIIANGILLVAVDAALNSCCKIVQQVYNSYSKAISRMTAAISIKSTRFIIRCLIWLVILSLLGCTHRLSDQGTTSNGVNSSNSTTATPSLQVQSSQQ